MKDPKRAEFHILLALSQGALHGLGIADEVDAHTEGHVLLGPGTLYRTLRKLAERKLIREVEGPEKERGSRRRFYELAPPGEDLLRREAARLERLVDVARDRDVLPSRA